MSSPHQSKWKKLLRWLPGVLISAIALYAVIYLVHGQDLRKAFTSATWWFIAIVAVVQTASLLVRGKAWQTILGKKVSFTQSFFGISEGYLFNNLFPLRAGEIARSVFVGQSSGLGMFHVLSTIIIERAFDIAIAASLVLITLPLVVGLAWVKTAAVTALILVFCALVILFLVAQNREKVGTWVEKKAVHSKFLKKYVAPQIRKLMDGLETLTNPKQFIFSFLWIALSWAMWISYYSLTMQQILPGTPLWTGAFLGGILSLGVAIPSAPAAVGVYEASFLAAVIALGGAESAGLAYAIILHVLQFLISGLFGIWGLIREGQNFSSFLNQVRENQDKTKIETSDLEN